MQIIHGIGFFLSSPAGKILMVRELKSKPHYGKSAGMLSVPFETIEDGETKESAIRRLIHEEIGGIEIEIITEPVFFKEFLIKLSAIHSVRLSVFTGIVADEFAAHPNDTDVEYYGWMSLQDILRLNPSGVRQEMIPICMAMNAR